MLAMRLATDSPPTERIRMIDSRRNDESPILSQILHNHFVGILDILTFKVGHLTRIIPSLINRTRRHLILANDSFSNRDSVIIFSESRSLMNDTRSRIRCNVSINKNSETLLSKLLRQACQSRVGKLFETVTYSFRKVIEERDILPSSHFLPLVLG